MKCSIEQRDNWNLCQVRIQQNPNKPYLTVFFPLRHESPAIMLIIL
jgi:hypothetical protein